MKLVYIIIVILILAALAIGAFYIMQNRGLASPSGYTSTASQGGGSSSIGSSSAPTTVHAWG